jgi:hypothetical protein
MSAVCYTVSPDLRDHAREIANARLWDSSRHLSAHRPTARNLNSQIRGALGELYTRLWLIDSGFNVESGFENDTVLQSDLYVNGWPIEVMTAKISDRLKTQFCIPPNKFRAASNRGAWGYIFAGTDDSDDCDLVVIQGGIQLSEVAGFPIQETFVNNPKFAVMNYVIPEESLISPHSILESLQS